MKRIKMLKNVMSRLRIGHIKVKALAMQQNKLLGKTFRSFKQERTLR